jgi:hypothetical protein
MGSYGLLRMAEDLLGLVSFCVDTVRMGVGMAQPYMGCDGGWVYFVCLI